MNWEAVGSLAEGIAAIGVIISLIYLAKQIKAQIRESQLSAAHEIAVGFRDMLLPFTTPEIADLFVRANADFDSLSASEKVQIIISYQRSFRLWEEAYYQHKGGRLDETIWNSMLKTYSAYLAAPGFARVWELRREFYNADFVEFVDSVQKGQLRWE